MLVYLFAKHNVVLRAASGNKTISEVSPEVLTSKFRVAVIDLRITELIMANGGGVPAEVDFYAQTKLNGTWVDVANVHFAFAQEPIQVANRLIAVGPKDVGVVVITPTDGAIADNTSQDVTLGEAVRVKVIVTPDGDAPPVSPTYAYEAKVTLQS